MGGGWGPEAHKAWNELAKLKAVITGERVSMIVTNLLQTLGIILHRENARSVLRRSTINMGRDCSKLLATSAACSPPLGTLIQVVLAAILIKRLNYFNVNLS